MTLTAFLAAWFLHLIAAASPGPTILMSARIGVSEGMRTGFLFSLGCAIGALFWAVAALFGLAVLFSPGHGVVAKLYHRTALSLQIAREDLLGVLFRWQESAAPKS